MKKNLVFGILLLLLCTSSFAQLKSPDEFLPHKWGETFTPHYMLVDYVQHVAANSDRVQLQEYGRTNQKRPLLLATISTPENLAKIDAIRENNLKKTGLLEGEPDPGLDVAIVWLSFSVHGNEAAGSESSMAVLYDLANPSNTRTQAWLQNTVVLIDPALNPDGYSRYTHWYRNVAGLVPDPQVATREHREPWPGGRVNHYLFDLNRDWAWQTQIESQQRVALYHQWMPHVHADIHEQGYNRPYYFAPAAQPYHPFITQWQYDFQLEIGKNHAKYFDQNGWYYFTKEVFDLLYPSYGDTYPMFKGAIGMTYEQGGSSRGGRSVLTENGDVLTLLDRVTHHKTTALSTVEVASVNQEKLLQNFENYYKKSSTNPPGAYKTYIVKGDNPKRKLKALCDLLERNRIQYGRIRNTRNVRAFDYTTGQTTSVEVESTDLVISAYQPLAVFAQVLFDPKVELVDSLTYDITAWSLPYAYGLRAYASTTKIDIVNGYGIPNPIKSKVASPYAYIVKWESLEDAHYLGQLLKNKVKVRFATADFQLEGQAYKAGTLVISRADNRQLGGDFDQIVQGLANELEQPIQGVKTGFAEKGSDLGSRTYRLIKTPKIAVLSGANTSPYSFGQVWYYFEQNLEYPISIFDAEQLNNLDLEDYNLLILPEGRYTVNDETAKAITSWVADGGNIIAIGRAISSLVGKAGFRLKNAKNAKKGYSPRLEPYKGQSRRRISNFIPGAIFKLKMDNSHPLSYGLPDYYFSLKTSAIHFPYQENLWNVGTLGEELMVSGFAGAEAQSRLRNSTVFAVQEGRGGGSITYLVDNPLFRCFWENGKFLFSNAVFFVGQ